MTYSSKHARRFAVHTLTFASLALTAFAPSELEFASERMHVDALASTATSARSVEHKMERLAIDDERLYWDVQPDGVVRTMGHGFKASFGPQGAAITPFLGSDVPRDFPVTFALECATVGGVVIHLNDASGASSDPQVGDQAITIGGAIPAVVGLRAYQCWYRDAAAFCTSSTFNLSNAVRISFTP
ncbi:MAG: hypothetical protein SGI72_14620 [Planctomycetota bacterium]|nr:hypothetical protein [Planctomycetota bacterium]